MVNYDSVCKKIFSDSDITEESCLKALNILNSRDINFGDLYFEHMVSQSFALEEGIVKGGSYSITRGVGVRAIKDGKTGFAYSDVLDNKSLIEACKAAHSITKGHRCDNTQINRLNRIESKQLYTEINPIDTVSNEKKAAILEILDKKARALDPRVTQVMANLACAHKNTIIMPTDSSMRYDSKPFVRISVVVVMEANGRIEKGSASTGGAFLLDEILGDDTLSYLANEAVRSACVNMEAVNAPAGSMTVVLGNGWPGVLIHEAVGHGLEGDFNRTGSSAFTDKIGQKVASEHCTIIDDGTIKNRRGSMNFDDEGTDSACNILIEKGILKGYMQDKQNAMLMNMKSTGNGRRESYNTLPLPRMTNTYLQNGNYEKDEIIKSVKNGIYAVNFKGGQVDITSGEFVFSTSEAYLIENGKITTPIKGATLIGNGPNTMQKVSMVGNDLEFDKGIGTCGKAGQSVPVGIGQPTVKVDELIVGGTNS